MTGTRALRLIGALLFLALVLGFATTLPAAGSAGWLLIAAAGIGAYMAMNIGANDVANNVGPSVGSGALTMGGAIVVAGVFEAAGALIAGGDVVGTIKDGIIDPELIPDPDAFVWLMMAALLAGALWLNIATAVGAPVSTTHSIVGGVLGAGIAAGGTAIANWHQVGVIVASWIISPVMGGVIAAALLYLIKRTVTYQKQTMQAARKVVPLLLTLMAWSFSTYLILKGLKHIWKVDFATAMLLGAIPAVLTFAITRPLISRASRALPDEKGQVNELFTLSLIFAAALLSFAHGANDVANAVGPLAAINDAITSHGVAAKAAVPLWVMLIGALGLSVGLALYGPRLIKTVGSEITELDKTRAFCIALAAAITVIVASQLGLPVSSTHIAVGGVFGVGFLREYLKVNYSRLLHEIESHHQGADREEVERFIKAFDEADVAGKGVMIRTLRRKANATTLSRKERRRLKKLYKQDLVKRSMLLKIIAAWVITVPASASLAAILFYTLRGLMLD
ncbi:MAG: anion permease [Pseudomonadales bacterium]